MHKHMHELEMFVRAGIPTIWLATHEERRVTKLLEGFREDLLYSVIDWDILQGARILYAAPHSKIPKEALEKCSDAVAMLQEFTKLDNKAVPAILVMRDMHKFIPSIEVIRAIQIFLADARPLKHIIFLSHKAAIPEELEKDVLLAHLGLPGNDDLNGIVSSILAENELTGKVEISPEHVKAVSGLTNQEALNAFSLTLTEKKKLDRQHLESFKLEAVKKSGMMEIFPAVDPRELGGLDALKSYMALRAKGFDDPNLPTPTGILLMGLPGGGKSLSAKAIASMLKMPLIKLDIASLKSKYVGESESKMGQALALIDAVSPAVIWLDKHFVQGKLC